MTRTPALLKPYKPCEISMDGCRSFCVPGACEAATDGFCCGCNDCDFGDPQGQCPDGGCEECWVRCWRRNNHAEWMKDINGLDFNTEKCALPFVGELPGCIPQIRDNVWDIYHPAYIVPIRRIMNLKNRKLVFRQKGIRHHWHIPENSKLIVSFCARDDIIEDIWSRQYQEWDENGRNFWEVLSDYKFDAALSVDFSCFGNYPRMEHLICMKRNIITAGRLAAVGIPVILDVMTYSDDDYERFLSWGKDNGLIWYNLNYQMTKKVPWVLDLICEKCDKLFAMIPEAKIIITGIGDAERVGILLRRYPGKISISTSNLLMHSQYRRVYSIVDHVWIKQAITPEEAFRRNLAIFNKAAELDT